jgi:hypothetical protein
LSVVDVTLDRCGPRVDGAPTLAAAGDDTTDVVRAGGPKLEDQEGVIGGYHRLSASLRTLVSATVSIEATGSGS